MNLKNIKWIFIFFIFFIFFYCAFGQEDSYKDYYEEEDLYQENEQNDNQHNDNDKNDKYDNQTENQDVNDNEQISDNSETSSSIEEDIKFSEEELARESVLPTFDRKESVLNRNILLSNRFEIGVFGGMSLIEPIYSQFLFGGSITYYLNEVHGFHLNFINWTSGYTDNAEHLMSEFKMNFDYTYGPEQLFFLDYQYSAWYGKISVTKEFVLNTSFYTLLGIGSILFGGQMHPGLDLGFGQKFYFSKHFALRVDLRFILCESPNPLSLSKSQYTTPQPLDAFKKTVTLYSILSGGIVYLF